MRKRLALYVAALCVCLAPMLSAQDAVKTDPKHYSVVSENDQVPDSESALRPAREVGDAQPIRRQWRCSSPMPRGSSAFPMARPRPLT